MSLKNAWGHLCTINHHKNLVMKGCFRLGLYRQGLLHDLSKYCPVEFFVGCKYYQGNMSPNNIERQEKGYSLAWLHHKGRNKHHMEYWIDYGLGTTHEEKRMVGMKMPVKYVVEMFVDRVSASKNYQKDAYTDESALIYYDRGVGHYTIHKDTAALLELMLVMLAAQGEDKTYAYIRNEILKGKVPYEEQEIKKITAEYRGKAQDMRL